MKKTLLGPRILLYPMPVMLIGANVDDKPNFMAVAWGGIANGEPPMISVALRHQRYTLKGVRQNMTFSVNLPSADMVKEVDYCGIVSGSKFDKVETCGFKVFYGKLGDAPLIKQCPVSMECKVEHILNLGTHALIIGRIEETHVSESCLADAELDIDKIKPLTYLTMPAQEYRALGSFVAKAFSVGKKLESCK